MASNTRNSKQHPDSLDQPGLLYFHLVSHRVIYRHHPPHLQSFSSSADLFIVLWLQACDAMTSQAICLQYDDVWFFWSGNLHFFNAYRVSFPLETVEFSFYSLLVFCYQLCLSYW